MDHSTTSIAIGLIVSLIFTEWFGLSGGGMIVPGYLALYLDKPASILLTLLAAFVTFGIVKGISQVAIVYGRRRIVLMVLFGFLVGAGIRSATTMLGDFCNANSYAMNSLPLNNSYFCVIGFIIPGLIALWMDRQGMIETLSPLMVSTVLVRLVLIVLGMGVIA